MEQAAESQKILGPRGRIAILVNRASEVARKGRKGNQSLSGNKYYANKLAELRADATNASRELPDRGVRETAALAQLVEVCFSPSVTTQQRRTAERELLFQLRTAWKETQNGRGAEVSNPELFPLSLLAETRRTYLVIIGQQMNGCYTSTWYDACAVMMRRLVENSIIEAFEGRELSSNVKDSKGDFLQLSDLVSAALAEKSWNLSRNARTNLPRLKDVGHISAHGRRFHARKEDIDKVEFGCRVVVEEFLRLGGLL
jgi:hypothetical protein